MDYKPSTHVEALRMLADEIEAKENKGIALGKNLRGKDIDEDVIYLEINRVGRQLYAPKFLSN